MEENIPTAGETQGQLDEHADVDDDYQENYGDNDPILIRNRRMNEFQAIQAVSVV